MSTYLLIHGAWHGAWCWRKVIPLLQQAGHTVIAPDLPGHGDDLTPLTGVTLEAYVQCVTALIDEHPGEERVILVGHGLAGMVISQVAEERPERIQRLVYLSALLPKSGETALQITARDQNQALAECLDVDDVCACLIPELASLFWYQDVDPNEIEEAVSCLTPQALLPLMTPVVLSERFNSVQRVYLSCRYDWVLSTTLQRQMYGATPCQRVSWLMTGHVPFFSAPHQLAERLHGFAS
jgi:pimeloyl-ACP methyl ester carboxylesterase